MSFLEVFENGGWQQQTFEVCTYDANGNVSEYVDAR